MTAARKIEKNDGSLTPRDAPHVAHTPTPWFWSNDRGRLCTIKMRVHQGGMGEPIARFVELNDALFIVRSCNAHDDLVVALKVAREHVRFFCEETDDEGTEDCKRDLALIDAALAKAAQTSDPRGEADPSNPRP